MASRRNNSGKAAVVAAALVGAGGVGAASYAAATAALEPESLSQAQTPEYVTVTSTKYDDKRAVQVKLEYGTPQLALANRGGMITHSTCAVGSAIESGSSPLHVDGQPIIALATSTPLWRNINPKTKGTDVDALHEAFRTLQLDAPKPGEAADQRTISAWIELRKRANHPKPETKTLALADTLWVPATKPPATQCHAGTGTRINPANPLITYQPTVTTARIVTMPNNLAPGQRKLTISGKEIPLNPDGTITDLATLSGVTHQQTQPNNPNEAATTPAELTLTTPVDVTVVPPSAVAGQGTSCVITPTGPTPVTVLNSRMGQTYITAAQPISQVATTPDATKTCG